MNKIIKLLSLFFFLTGCAETFALLGPASSIVGGGNIAQSATSSAISYGATKQKGSTPGEHVVAYGQKNNPEKCHKHWFENGEIQ